MHRLLRRAGVTVTLDDATRRIGIAIGDAKPVFQPLDPQAVQLALAHRISSAAFRDTTITADAVDGLASMYPDDPGYRDWLQSMVGMPQTSVASLPPGWEKSQIGEALKAFAKDIKKNAPELYEALKKQNEQA